MKNKIKILLLLCVLSNVVSLNASGIESIGIPKSSQQDKQSDSEIVNIPDLNLKKTLNNILNKSRDPNADITREQLGRLVTINVEDVADLTGLEYATSLKNLIITESPLLNDLTAISKILTLENLELFETNIDDISMIETEELIYLIIENEKLQLKLDNEDVKQIAAKFPKLFTVNLVNANDQIGLITDISPFSKSRDLKNVNFENNQIKDFSPLNDSINVIYSYSQVYYLDDVDIDGTEYTMEPIKIKTINGNEYQSERKEFINLNLGIVNKLENNKEITIDPAKEPEEANVIRMFIKQNVTPTVNEIIFDANGGEGEMEKQVFKNDEKQKLNPSKLTREGFVLLFWNTQPDFRGKIYRTDDIITVKGKITLYAEWYKRVVRVKFLGNKETRTIDINYGDKFIIPENKDKIEGKEFVGWFTEKEGKGISYKEGTEVNLFEEKDKDEVLIEIELYPYFKNIEIIPEVKPVEPTKPVNPVEPTKPVNPVEPTKPVNPVEPTKPVNPVEPTKPVNPVEPTKLKEKPTDIILKNGETKLVTNLDKLANTGVFNNGIIYLVIAMVSLLLIRRKR